MLEIQVRNLNFDCGIFNDICGIEHQSAVLAMSEGSEKIRLQKIVSVALVCILKGVFSRSWVENNQEHIDFLRLPRALLAEHCLTQEWHAYTYECFAKKVVAFCLKLPEFSTHTIDLSTTYQTLRRLYNFDKMNEEIKVKYQILDFFPHPFRKNTYILLNAAKSNENIQEFLSCLSHEVGPIAHHISLRSSYQSQLAAIPEDPNE